MGCALDAESQSTFTTAPALTELKDKWGVPRVCNYRVIQQVRRWRRTQGVWGMLRKGIRGGRLEDIHPELRTREVFSKGKGKRRGKGIPNRRNIVHHITKVRNSLLGATSSLVLDLSIKRKMVGPTGGYLRITLGEKTIGSFRL